MARWLRIGGYDTEYRKNSQDESLLLETKTSGRILLSKDEVLVARANKNGAKAVYLRGGSDELNLAQLVRELGLVFDPNKSRCPRCNNILRSVEKMKIASKIPSGTFKEINNFWHCENCGGVYWQGSHWPKIIETLENASKRDS